MNKNRFLATWLTVFLIACLMAAPVLADKKIKAYKAQTTHSFVNAEGQPAFGLVVTLSNSGEVKTDEESGQAGPFRDISGNGTGMLEMTNPVAPIEPGSEKFDLVFGSYSKEVGVKTWWWTDAKGKRIGKKNKG